MIVVIPAFEPTERLPTLVAELRARAPGLRMLVVDDGSAGSYAAPFAAAAALGAEVLRHETNRGKGAALKTAFRHILSRYPGCDVVTADADGQHTPDDILAIAGELRVDRAGGTRPLVLGCRAFSGAVPTRSRLGNAVSRALFRSAAGWRLSDTQTGLRGIPSVMLPWLLDVPGERFEYELQMLLRLRSAGFRAREREIETVYLDANASSHFRPIVDSVHVTLPLALFAGSSLLAFAVDAAALFLFTWLTGWLAASIIAARVVSASVNFAVNRRWVFRDGVRGGGQALRYGVLALALLASNIVWLSALTQAGVPLAVAKIVTEIVLFVTSYNVQRAFVFPAVKSVGGAEPNHRDFLSPAHTGHSRRIGTPLGMEINTRNPGSNP